MIRIFISYSRASQDVIKTLAQDFEEFGHKVWFDNELTGGQAWWEQILEKIRECDLFVCTFSPQALDSYACKLEWTYAHALGKTILPILVADDVSMKLMPSELSTLQYVDYRSQDKKAAFALNKALTKLPAPQPLHDPLPAPPEVPVSYLGSLKNQIETTQSLSFEEQSALVLQLKERLANQDEINDVRELLQRLRQRDDLLAKIAREIDFLLISTAKEPPEPESEPTEPTSPGGKIAPINIVIESASEDIAEILREVLCNKETWTLQSPTCIIEISSSESTLMVQAEWEEWANMWSNLKLQGLKQLKWKVDMKQILLQIGAILIVAVTWGLALLIPNCRKIMKMRKATRTWITRENRSQLTDVTIDIILALKTIAPDSKTITADRKKEQSNYRV